MIQGKSTNYAIAKQLGISRQSMSRYMNGKGAMDDKAAVKVARYLNIPEIILIAAVNAEKASYEDDKQFWTALIHEKLETAALDEKIRHYAKSLLFQRAASDFTE